MDRDTFWHLVEASRRESSECEAQAARLVRLLEELPLAEMISFQEHLNEVKWDAYRWDLWAVAFIVNGGCSDDGFMDFRAWLIGQGRAYFEAALADPIRAADRAEYGAAFCESMLYVARDAYETRTGTDMPWPDPLPTEEPLPKGWGEPAGQRWSEDELEQLYPDLYRRFFGVCRERGHERRSECSSQ